VQSSSQNLVKFGVYGVCWGGSFHREDEGGGAEKRRVVEFSSVTCFFSLLGYFLDRHHTDVYPISRENLTPRDF